MSNNFTRVESDYSERNDSDSYGPVEPELPKSKDNKLLAIIFMNIAALTATMLTASYRVIA